MAYVTGFSTWRGALQFERAAKRGRGRKGRAKHMRLLAMKGLAGKDFTKDKLSAWGVFA